MSSWWDIVWCPVPIWLTSRPDDQDLPSARQITARTDGVARSSAKISKRRPSMASSNALCFSTFALVIVAMGPSMARRTRSSGMAGDLGSLALDSAQICGVAADVVLVREVEERREGSVTRDAFLHAISHELRT